MRRTILLLFAFAVITVVFLETTGSSSSSNSETPCCNVNFIVTNRGLPQRNIVITVLSATGGGQCTTDSSGKCSICVLGTRGSIDTIKTSCGIVRRFEACSTPVEVLECGSANH